METVKERIIRLRKENPCLQNSDIGKAVSRSREYVRQVLSEAGLKTVSVKWLKHYICNNCGKDFIPIKGSDYKLFCSLSCYDNYHRINVRCDNCGKWFSRTICRMVNYKGMNRKYSFCNNECRFEYSKKHPFHCKKT